jgi:hypothetical protein
VSPLPIWYWRLVAIVLLVAAAHVVTQSTTGESLLAILANVAEIVGVLIVLAIPVTLWVRYRRSLPLDIVHDESCVQWWPEDRPEWQQVRLKVVVKKRWATVHHVHVVLSECSDPDLNVGADMKKTHDNELERFDLRGGVTCHRGKPAFFDVAIHRPNHSSVIEYSDEKLRGMGAIPSTLYPWWVRMEFTAEGRIPDKEKPVRPTTRGFFLEIAHDGELRIHPEKDIEADRVLKPKPTGPPGFRARSAAAASPSASGGLETISTVALPPAGPTGAAGPPAGVAPFRQSTPRASPSSRTAGAYTGSIVSSVGVAEDEGKVRTYEHSPIRPGRSTGDLPIAIDIADGLAGSRNTVDLAGESWVWTAEDVALINESDDPIRCRVFLIADVPTEFVTLRELPRVPNDVVSLAPRGHVQVVLQFRMQISLFSKAGKLNPGSPKELLFREIGGLERERRVPFAPPPATPAATESGDGDGTPETVDEDEAPEPVPPWSTNVERSSEGGVRLTVRRPDNDEGRLVQCTVEDERGTQWKFHLSSGGFSMLPGHGYDVAEWSVDFPNHFHGGASELPLRGGTYRYTWVANYGTIFMPDACEVATGTFVVERPLPRRPV